MEHSERHIPWYKNYILLLIIALPMLSVAGSFALLFTALSHNDSSVLEGYYKDGLSPKQMAKTALSHQMTANITGGVLTIKRNNGSDDTVQLKLEHPTLTAKDIVVNLKAIAPNTYPLPAETLRQLRIQRWYLRLHDVQKTWEIQGQARGRINGQDQPIILSVEDRR